MPAVRKLTKEEVEQPVVAKKRGRPAGSRNRPKEGFDADGFETEKLYTYKAKDGCTMQSAVKSKTMNMSCKHGNKMELQK